MNDRFRMKLWDKINGIWVKEFRINQDGLVLGMYNAEQAMKRRFVLVQCTGLKDKNGKLIYEGDIVSIDDGELKGIAQRHNKFDEYYGCIEIKLICRHLTIYKPTVFAESEIIGNIYENVDLLN